MAWRWPWSRERRAAGGYTAALLDASWRLAAGSGGSGPTAAAEAAAGLVGRAFAVADVEGVEGPRAAALCPATRYRIGRDLVLAGEHLSRIVVAAGRVRLDPAHGWTVEGAPDPSTWRYHATLAGPSRSVAWRGPSAEALHVRIPGAAARPWEGVSPVETVERALVAAASGVLHGKFQDPVAASRLLATRDSGLTPARLEETLRPLKEKPGTGAVKGSMTAADRGAAWDLLDLAPRLDAGTVEMLEGARREILRAAGIPDAAFSATAGAAAREAARQVLVGLVRPLAELLREEAADKLDAPGIRIRFRRLGAADVAGKARAVRGLVAAGMRLQAAAAVAGLELPDGREARSGADDLVAAVETLARAAVADPADTWSL